MLAVAPLLRELLLTYTQDPLDDTPERGRLRAVLLDRLRASQQQPLYLPTPENPQLRTLCDHLRTNPADNRTLATLGREIGASDRTLSRLFRADLGMTFPQGREESVHANPATEKKKVTDRPGNADDGRHCQASLGSTRS